MLFEIFGFKLENEKNVILLSLLDLKLVLFVHKREYPQAAAGPVGSRRQNVRQQ
jgi:hypothetical protein